MPQWHQDALKFNAIINRLLSLPPSGFALFLLTWCYKVAEQWQQKGRIINTITTLTLNKIRIIRYLQKEMLQRHIPFTQWMLQFKICSDNQWLMHINIFCALSWNFLRSQNGPSMEARMNIENPLHCVSLLNQGSTWKHFFSSQLASGNFFF